MSGLYLVSKFRFEMVIIHKLIKNKIKQNSTTSFFTFIFESLSLNHKKKEIKLKITPVYKSKKSFMEPTFRLNKIGTINIKDIDKKKGIRKFIFTIPKIFFMLFLYCI